MKNEIKIKVNYGKLEDINLPPIIYKYRSWSNKYHKRFLNNREVFLASPKTFEDELDCHNPIRFDLLTKQQINYYFIWYSKKNNSGFTRQQHRKFARDWSKKSDINHPKIVKEFMSKSITEYYDHEGILSLTENWNNDKMWKKYGDDGKGICIGYDTKVLFKVLGGGGPVEYCDKLPIIMPEPFMEFMEAHRNRIYFKLKKWGFEEEYRTKIFWEEPASISDRRIQLPVEAFKKVILGDNISESDKVEVISIIKEKIGELQIEYRKNNL